MLNTKTTTRKVPLMPRTRIAIVAANYNRAWVDQMLESVLGILNCARIKDIHVVRVPGSFEIPVAVSQLARKGTFDAIIALGVILQGKTSHADHIALATTFHLQRISVETGVPVIHQVLTPQNKRDAVKRLKLRGEEAAWAALEMVQG